MELFECEVYNCKLTKKTCGKRFSKSLIVKESGDGRTRYESVLPYSLCTGCSIGEQNIQLIPPNERGRVKKKNAPGAPRLQGPLHRLNDEST